jgi:hypothetical protein
MKRAGSCRLCGKHIEEYEVQKLASGTEITTRKINYQLKIFKGDIYQQTVRLDSRECLEMWVAASLPKFIEVARSVSA